MFGITLPYYLILPTLLCFLILVLLFAKRKTLFYSTKQKSKWRAITVFFLVYGLIVGYAAYRDLYAQWNLNRYDLDQDGLIGDSEYTPATQSAIDYLIHDTGRTLAVFMGIPIAGILAILVYADSRIYERKKRRQVESIGP